MYPQFGGTGLTLVYPVRAKPFIYSTHIVDCPQEVIHGLKCLHTCIIEQTWVMEPIGKVSHNQPCKQRTGLELCVMYVN